MAAAALPADVVAQVEAALEMLQLHLRDGLRSIHLYGSAIAGGLKPDSDIDLLVTVETPLAPALRKALMSGLLDVSAPPGTAGRLRPLEVTVLVDAHMHPWRYPPCREMQFGEWLRDDLVAGVFEPAQLDHDVAILLTEARRHSVALFGAAADQVFTPVPADDFRKALAATVAQWATGSDWHGDERNVVLALARIWYSAQTGDITSKDAAATWLLPRLPMNHRGLLERARDAYLGSGNGLATGEPINGFVQHARAAVETILKNQQ